jgi:hypothetical protein
MNETQIPESEQTARIIRDLAANQLLKEPRFITAQDGTPYLVVPAHGADGQLRYEVTQKPEHFRDPRDRPSQLKVVTEESFVNYYLESVRGEAKRAEPLVMGSLSEMTVHAIFDPHGINEARHSQHTATLQLRPSNDWTRWEKISGEALSQGELADFLEEMEHTIEAPAAAQIQTAVANLEISRNGSFKLHTNRQDGSVIFNYQDENEAVGSVKLPEKIFFSAAPFYGSKPMTMEARLRYRIRDGRITFHLAVMQITEKREEAFEAVCASISSEISRHVHICA